MHISGDGSGGPRTVACHKLTWVAAQLQRGAKDLDESAIVSLSISDPYK